MGILKKILLEHTKKGFLKSNSLTSEIKISTDTMGKSVITTENIQKDQISISEHNRDIKDIIRR